MEHARTIAASALLAGAGRRVSMPPVATVGVGVLLVVFGNYMGKLRKNFFVGIKSPWTLASDAVWQRTHRLAGWLFVLAGVVWIAAGLARRRGGRGRRDSVGRLVFHLPARRTARLIRRAAQ